MQCVRFSAVMSFIYALVVLLGRLERHPPKRCLVVRIRFISNEQNITLKIGFDYMF